MPKKGSRHSGGEVGNAARTLRDPNASPQQKKRAARILNKHKARSH